MLKMMLMLFLVFSINQDIIKEDKNKIIKLFPKKICHQPIKGCRALVNPKRHDDKLVMPKSSIEGGLGDVFFLDPDLIAARSKIYLREYLGLA